ncbi:MULTISPECIES: ferric reductase-like transmembrane domain-containing protein [Arthrobacter]|uniref:Ferric reductase-like transmembrane domain-containing protein n=2 Tax=Arthrobacter TaxID=1663 RepID=A0ABU9KJ83_9MICC|nr:ferric reductase-like transmembrane domain-containing protein [Arthrobacter sp. YJM1]MDP5225974.1 ferric reductase-like transmembrane domain-containing protein [Arthrobacter sp. YJM1]
MNTGIAERGWSLPEAASAPSEDYRSALRRRLFAADLAVVLCWASTAGAVALYLLSGGVSQIHSKADAVTALGIIAGLAGTNLILIMLLLAARIPWLDRAVGQDVAIGWHRRLGKPVLYLILAHAALLTLGYAATDGLDVVGETAAFLSNRDMILAYLALALLLAVVVTSLVAVRRKFPYEAWHLIHLLSYAAVLLALPHELSYGGVLAAGTVERIYWIALYLLAYGAAAWYRFAKPLLLSLRHDFRVVSVERLAPDVISIHLRGRELGRLGIAGGQYATWRFWSARNWWHSHPLSFSAMPHGDLLRITVRGAGSGTAGLAGLRRGTRVWFEGPYGLFSRHARSAPNLALVGAGIGVTPLRALLEDSRHSGGETALLVRASDESQLYLWEELHTLCEWHGGTAFADVGPRSRATSSWLSADAVRRGVSLQSVFPRILHSDLYICGPGPWAELVAQEAKALGLEDHQIHLERFDS